MSGAPIEHLMFSTRAAEPESGSDFNREIIAASAGIVEDARREFALRADLASSLLRQRRLPPIYTSTALGEARLFCRAVSLGAYRKGSHQLLIHGLMLEREHLEEIDGNPFLLEHPASGVELADRHPGSVTGGGEHRLEPLRLAAGFDLLSRRLDHERLATLSGELAHWDLGFAELYERLVIGEGPIVCGLEEPDSRLVEWLLLHLHRDDRAEIDFHTWYTHRQAVGYRLMLAPESDLPQLRRQFADLAVWRPGAERAAHGALGDAALQLRRRSYVWYLSTVDAYRLSFLAPGPPRPLAPSEAEICLRHELGEELGPEEETVRQLLARRGDDQLTYRVHELSRSWRQGVDDFAATLAAQPESAAGISPRQLDEALLTLPEAAWVERWALAVLAESELGENDEAESEALLAETWSALAPPERFGELLALFSSEREVSFAVPFLEAQVLRAARAQLRAGEPREPLYWPSYLRWLAERRAPAAATAARVEALADSAPGGLGRDWHRALIEVCWEIGLEVFAYRVLFQKEAPGLAEADFYARVREGVGRLLDGDGGADGVLKSLLREPPAGGRGARGADQRREADRLGSAVLSAMADWLESQEDAEAALGRWRRLLERQGSFLETSKIPAAGAFLARLAISRLADRLATAVDALAAAASPAAADVGFRAALIADAARRLESLARGRERPQATPHLALGTAALLEVRMAESASEAADRALLALLLHAMVHAEGAAEVDPRGLGRLRRSMAAYLERLLTLDRFPELAPGTGPWRHLLLDELLLSPPEGLEDPRYRACLLLAWRRWVDAVAAGRSAAEIGVERLLAWDGRPAAVPPHLELMRSAVPAERRPAAEALIASSVAGRAAA